MYLFAANMRYSATVKISFCATGEINADRHPNAKSNTNPNPIPNATLFLTLIQKTIHKVLFLTLFLHLTSTWT